MQDLVGYQDPTCEGEVAAAPSNHFAFERGHELVEIGLHGELEGNLNSQVANSFAFRDQF